MKCNSILIPNKTEIDLNYKNIEHLTSKYSLSFYLLFINYQKKQLRISVEDLKRFLCVIDKYKVYNNFKSNVIDMAINDINTYTDLIISYASIRTVRKITELLFDIQYK